MRTPSISTRPATSASIRSSNVLIATRGVRESRDEEGVGALHGRAALGKHPLIIGGLCGHDDRVVGAFGRRRGTRLLVGHLDASPPAIDAGNSVQVTAPPGVQDEKPAAAADESRLRVLGETHLGDSTLGGVEAGRDPPRRRRGPIPRSRDVPRAPT